MHDDFYELNSLACETNWIVCIYLTNIFLIDSEREISLLNQQSIDYFKECFCISSIVLLWCLIKYFSDEGNSISLLVKVKVVLGYIPN